MTEKIIMRLVVRSALLLVLLGAILWFAWTVRGVLVLVLISAILATGLSPLVDALSGCHPPRARFRIPRGVALLLIYLALITGLVLIIVGVIPPLADEIDDLVASAPGYVQNARQTLQAWEETYPFLQELDARLLTELEKAIVSLSGIPEQAARVLRFAAGVVNVVLSTVIVLVLTFYLMVDGGTIKSGVLRLLPAKNRPVAEVVLERARIKIGSWLTGQLFLSAIIGIATFIGLVLLGVPYAVLLAVLAAIGEVIPMVGPVVTAIPAVLVATTKSPMLGLATIVLYILIQQLENHIVVPQVMRRAVDLPPGVIIIALMMGGQLLGILGAILAVPVTAILAVLVSEIIALRDGRIEAPAPIADAPEPAQES